MKNGKVERDLHSRVDSIKGRLEEDYSALVGWKKREGESKVNRTRVLEYTVEFKGCESSERASRPLKGRKDGRRRI